MPIDSVWHFCSSNIEMVRTGSKMMSEEMCIVIHYYQKNKNLKNKNKLYSRGKRKKEPIKYSHIVIRH